MKIAKVLVGLLMRLLSFLPLKAHYALARVLSFLLEKVFRYRRSVVRDNISCAFPDKDASWVRATAHGFYGHLGDMIAEAVWFGGCRPGSRRLTRSRIVRFEGGGELARLHASAPDIVVLMSHSGNWELFGGYAQYESPDGPFPMNDGNACIVYLRQSSRLWDEILRDNRTAPVAAGSSFEGYLESRDFIRYALGHRGQKKFYNVITDQYPYFGSTLPVRFMGRDTLTMKGAADVARKIGAAVCYLGMSSESRGHYVCTFTTVCQDASELSSQQIMDSYYSLLEQDIRLQPWNYLWSHRRWKHFNT